MPKKLSLSDFNPKLNPEFMNNKKITFLSIMLVSFISISNAQLLSENFDNVSSLTNWDIINVSNPIGTTSWQQGSGTFDSNSGVNTSYISANSFSTSGEGTISTWLILPTLSLKDGDNLSFYTRSGDQASYPDRLQVRLSSNGSSSIAPTTEFDTADYTVLLLDINPTLSTNVYPETYTEYSVTISGIGNVATDSRIAFRYFVTNGGTSPAPGVNSFAIAIDDVIVTEQSLSIGNNDIDTNSFNHFYNKSTSTLSLKSENFNFEKIEVYNILGQSVLIKNLSNTTENINIENLKRGIYIAKTNINGSTKSFKFLKD